MGLYWARPLTFINLDSRNRWFMGDMSAAGPTVAQVAPKEKDDPIHDGEAYLAICDTIRSQLGTEACPYTSFPELSSAAFDESERVNKEKKAASKKAEQEAQANALGDADVETTHYWLYAPGEGAGMWDECFRGRDWEDFESFKRDLEEYVVHWNTRRRQVKLKGLTPVEFQNRALRKAS